MKLRHLFTINLFVAAFFGLSCTFFPAWVIGVYGVETNAAAIWMARLVGGSILGFATLMWFGRNTPLVPARRAIALALLVQDAIGLGASLEFQIRGGANALGWSSPLLYGLLALGYAYFLFARPRDS